MNNIWEITLSDIVPVIISSIFTFLLTKYHYSHNRPLDKFEIAYNRFYYPVFRLIQGAYHKKETDYTKIYSNMKSYFVKCEKYINVTTVKNFNNFSYAINNNIFKKHYFNALYNDISTNCFKSRKALGYIQPGIFGNYVCMKKEDKLLMRLCIEFVFLYIFAFISTSLSEENFPNIVIYISNFFLLATYFIFIIELIMLIINYIYLGFLKIGPCIGKIVIKAKGYLKKRFINTKSL